MANYIKSVYSGQLERGGSRTDNRPDGRRRTCVVYEIIDTDAMDIERIVLVENRGDDMQQFDDLITVEQAIAEGKLTKAELDDIELNVWRKRKCSEVSDWAGDINYFIKNAPNDMFLMIPIRYTYYRKEETGILVKYHSREYYTKRSSYGAKQVASVLLSDGKVIDVNPDNIISVTDDAMMVLLEKYTDYLINAKTPIMDMSALFPFTDVDEKTSEAISKEYERQVTNHIKGRKIILGRMRKGLADNINRKCIHLSEKEKERIIHRMMIQYFGEDIDSTKIH